MSVEQRLLESTDGRALACVAYGAGGLEKTLAVRTLPPPVLYLGFEGGVGPLGPWLRRSRRWTSPVWRAVGDSERQALWDMVVPALRQRYTIQPHPYIDAVAFDNMVPDAWEEAVRVVGTLEVGEYRSVVVDPLLEWNVSAQAYSKAKAGVGVDDLMHVKIWGPTQERCAIVLRRLRNYRDAGVFVYLTAQEMIDKDYIEDPRSAKGGVAPQEPYSIRGTAAVPGQLTATVQHLADLMFHVKSVGGRASWVTQPEVISPGSGAVWEAKDRYGRLADKYVYPNFRTLLKSFYGSKVVEIYGQGPTDRQTDGLEPAAAASTA